jgi:hypothetical protein
VQNESIRKVSAFGRVADLQADSHIPCQGFCAPEEIRTPNLLIRSQMLYPLSYGRIVQLFSYLAI